MSEHSESVILDVTDFDNWPNHYFSADEVRIPTGGKLIPQIKRSTVVQVDKEAAEQEACRLAIASPGHRFAVFTFAGVVEAKHVATHITLGGKVIDTTLKPVWQEHDL